LFTFGFGSRTGSEFDSFSSRAGSDFHLKAGPNFVFGMSLEFSL
jgi:hypothetical protein